MKNFKLLPIFLLTALLIFGAGLKSVHAADSVLLVNKSGMDIYYLYIADAESDDWGFDYLGSTKILNGSSKSINVPFGVEVFKLKVIFKNDDEFIVGENFNKNRIRQITITPVNVLIN